MRFVAAVAAAGVMTSAMTDAMMVVLPDGTRLTGSYDFNPLLSVGKFSVANGKLTCSGKYFTPDPSYSYSAKFVCTDGKTGILSGEGPAGVITFSDGQLASFAIGVTIAKLVALAPPKAPAQERKPEPEAKAAKTADRPLPPADTSPPEFPLDPTGKATTEVTVVLEADPGGTFTVPVFINKSVEVKFFVDSGAADIMLPSDVATTLMRNDALVDDDIYGEAVYGVASGGTTKATMIILKELNVGGAKLRNVRASVGDDSAPLLLGQSFLKRFGAWSLDNQRHVLVLKAPPPATAAP